jgi:hypothetical protein
MLEDSDWGRAMSGSLLANDHPVTGKDSEKKSEEVSLWSNRWSRCIFEQVRNPVDQSLGS